MSYLNMQYEGKIFSHIQVTGTISFLQKAYQITKLISESKSINTRHDNLTWEV